MPQPTPTRDAPDSSAYLNPQTLAAVGALELRARMIVEGLMTGMHRSPYQGFSVEFAQHRPYTPGDDIRHLDWKIFGRTDKLYLKQYQKETNLDLVLLVDASGSMAYSSLTDDKRRRTRTWRKYDHAAAIAAAMAYLAIQQQDRVGLVVFADKIRSVARPSNSTGHWRSIVETLSQPPASPPNVSNSTGGIETADRTTDLSRLFDQMIAKLTQRSLVVLISDLFDQVASLERGLAQFRHRRHDLIVLQVLDHAELNFPFRDPSEFIGLEDEGKVNLDPAALRKAYLESLHAHLHSVEQVCRRFRFDHLLLDSSTSLAAPLSHFLARRTASVTHGKH